MDRFRRVLSVFCASLISIGLHGQQVIDWDRRLKVETASLSDWLSSSWFENTVMMFLLLGGAVWVAFLLSAWRMSREKQSTREKSPAPRRRFPLPVSDIPRIGPDPFDIEEYQPRLKAARFSPDSPSPPSRN